MKKLTVDKERNKYSIRKRPDIEEIIQRQAQKERDSKNPSSYGESPVPKRLKNVSNAKIAQAMYEKSKTKSASVSAVKSQEYLHNKGGVHGRGIGQHSKRNQQYNLPNISKDYSSPGSKQYNGKNS